MSPLFISWLVAWFLLGLLPLAIAVWQLSIKKTKVPSARWGSLLMVLLTGLFWSNLARAAVNYTPQEMQAEVVMVSWNYYGQEVYFANQGRRVSPWYWYRFKVGHTYQVRWEMNSKLILWARPLE